jgi:hypothetical protein
VRQWVHEQLDASLARRHDGAIVILDPERLLSDTEAAHLAENHALRHAEDWRQLRLLWDVDVRGSPPHEPFVILVRSTAFTSPTDLPWDIEHEAAVVVRLRWPVPTELREAFRAAPELADGLAAATKTHHAPPDILAEALEYRPGDAASELRAVARLRADPGTPAAVWDAVAASLRTDLANRTAASRGDLAALQDAWNDWATHGQASPSAAQLEASPGALTTLLAAGLLSPAPAATKELPAWTAIGIVQPNPSDLLAELIQRRPDTARTLTEWIDTAAWWGTVRAAASDIATGFSEESIWRIWNELDGAFNPWLQRSYGTSLQAAAATPRAVHQIARFLARRVDDGAKVVLVVIDGLSFAQWTRLRSVTGLHVEESTGCLTMIPTLTNISRQAIFAGALPIDFADTLNTTNAEPRRWTAFWTTHGLHERDINFTKTLGATPNDVPDITGTVAAIVVNAIDQILHGAAVLGDPQVATDVDLWARTGFLQLLVQRATVLGYEVWLTSDHGNIPTTPGAVPQEGDTLESAGTRVRLYPNPTLRQQAQEHGIIWDPPGLPEGVLNPLFAPGRRGYHTRGVRVSHGGISLDEVIVPLVKVTP